MKGKASIGRSLTEAKVMRCFRYRQKPANDTKRVSLQLSLFYLSHACLLYTLCHLSNWLTALRMPYATEVILFLVADSADERLVAETVRFPSFESR